MLGGEEHLNQSEHICDSAGVQLRVISCPCVHSKILPSLICVSSDILKSYCWGKVMRVKIFIKLSCFVFVHGCPFINKMKKKTDRFFTKFHYVVEFIVS